MPLPECQKELPADLERLVIEFGRSWAKSPLRPAPDQETILHWKSLIECWATDESLPLLVRKHRDDRGVAIQHESGRILVPCDNSSAHWAFTQACAGVRPSIDDIRSLLENDRIPVAMIQKEKERQIASYHCRLSAEFNVNIRGWKLAHIRNVGIGRGGSHLSNIPMQHLVSKFVNFLSPENMFVMPIKWGGIAEIDSVLGAIAEWKP